MAEVHGVVVVGACRSCGSASSPPRAGAPAAPGRRPRPRSRRRRRSRPRSATSGSSAFRTKRVAARRARTPVGPAVGQQLELAVAVELVAEQVRQQHEPRAQVARHGRQPRLVHLEQPELAGRRGPRRAARWPRPSACSSPRGCGPASPAALEDRARPSTRWWSCRWSRRSSTEPSLEPAGQPAQRARRRAGSSSRPGAWCRRCGRPAARPHGRAARAPGGTSQAAGGTMTRRQRGSTVTVAGVAPIGSPSA